MLVPLAFLMLWALVSDLRTSTIPNTSFLIGTVYALIATYLGWNRFGLTPMMLGMLVGFLFFAYPAYRSWIGMGDFKLMGMIGLYLGPSLTLMACLYTSLFGGLLILAHLCQRKRLRTVMKNFFHLKRNEETVPYALAICLGTIATLALPH